MKLLTDDHWSVLIEQMDWLKFRIRELETQNVALLDRLLIQQGQLPTDMSTIKIVQQEEQQNKDLFETLTAEEIGEEPKDEDLS